MSRTTTPRGKIARRFGANLFGNPKFDRLLSRRPNPPGTQGVNAARKKVSEYGQQLNEKQKIKLTYGLGERQFSRLYHRALRQEGVTSENIAVLLELRLDNVVYRLGLAPTRAAARQAVLHGHIYVNGRRVNISSFEVRPGDVLTVKDNTRSRSLAAKNIEESASREVPNWLTLDKDGLRGEVVTKPLAAEIAAVADIQKVVELYSK